MVEFVNAKINIGLQIVHRRADGYHDLQTIFYPIGRYAGRAENPVSFCDILEITASKRPEPGFALRLSGRPVDCPLEKNLVWRAADAFYKAFSPSFHADIHLEKHLPDGAGIGGGSADAAFTVRKLARLQGLPAEEKERLAEILLSLGADVPFFSLNRPAYASGVGECLQPLPLDLGGYWLLLVKPDVYISTREAFAGVVPRMPVFDLRQLPDIPVADWKQFVHNDFEDSIFPRHPLLAEIKERLYSTGALYASLTGSGSCLYGIFTSRVEAQRSMPSFSESPTIAASYLLKM